MDLNLNQTYVEKSLTHCFVGHRGSSDGFLSFDVFRLGHGIIVLNNAILFWRCLTRLRLILAFIFNERLDLIVFVTCIWL